MRKNENKEKDFNYLSYIKVDLDTHKQTPVDHIKSITKMMKWDFHDALIRMDKSKMISMNHIMKETTDYLEDNIIEMDNKDPFKRILKGYIRNINFIRETFSSILNTQQIISDYINKLTPTQIRILILLNNCNDMTIKEFIENAYKSEQTIKKSIDGLMYGFSLPIIEKFTTINENKVGRLKYHYRLTYHGRLLISYIEDSTFDGRHAYLIDVRDDVLKVFNKQKENIETDREKKILFNLKKGKKKND